MKHLLVAVIATFLPSVVLAQVEPGAIYHLKTAFRGPGECLEANEFGADNATKAMKGNSFMDKCQNVSGQSWTFKSTGDGYFTMHVQRFQGAERRFVGNPSDWDVANGAAFLSPGGNKVPQEVEKWKIEKVNGDFYRLKTQFRGGAECLEGNHKAGSAKGGAAHMATCSDSSGQKWKLEMVTTRRPVEPKQ
jgi:hypothetical protein